jgi:hypothetical protein
MAAQVESAITATPPAVSPPNHMDRQESFGPSDLEELAKAAFLIGKGQDGSDLLSRAHKKYMGQGRV